MSPFPQPHCSIIQNYSVIVMHAEKLHKMAIKACHMSRNSSSIGVTFGHAFLGNLSTSGSYFFQENSVISCHITDILLGRAQ